MTEAHKTWVAAHFAGAEPRLFTLNEYATGQPGDVPDGFGQKMDFCRTVLARLDRLVGSAVLKATQP